MTRDVRRLSSVAFVNLPPKGEEEVSPVALLLPLEDALAAGGCRLSLYLWIKVRKNAGVKGRWHDNRHTLVTELAESGAGDEVIMSIAGHVSRAMLSRYSHIRMEAKRRALDEIAARQCDADAKRQTEAELREVAAVSPSALVQ